MISHQGGLHQGLRSIFFFCLQKLAKLLEEERLREEAGFYDMPSEDEEEKQLEAQLAAYVPLTYLPSTSTFLSDSFSSVPSKNETFFFFRCTKERKVAFCVFIFHHECPSDITAAFFCTS